MFIYKFATWGAKKGELYAITKIEVEEKPKTYISGSHRINKDDIGKLQVGFENKMYLLDNNPEPFISAMKNNIEKNIKSYETRAAAAKENLARWEALTGGAEE
jgi:hypothetical protein